MDRRERSTSLTELLLTAFDGQQAQIWTAMPCIVSSYDATKQICVLQPAIQARVTNPDGSKVWITIKEIVDVPVVFPSGGGFSLTFPIAPGDEALAVFAQRCIDAWWALGGVQVQQELRMHNISDGFAFVGPRSQPRKLSGVSTSTVQLREDDGSTYIELAGGGIVNIVATETHFTGEVWANGKRIDETHRHPGVNIGIGQTGQVS